MASPEERGRLIFPSDWDMSETEALPSERKSGRPSVGDDANMLYGDIMLMERVAERTGLKTDLVKAFEGNKEKADAVLTIAMYQVSNGGTLNRVRHWQRIEKTPCPMELTAPLITNLTQSITEGDRLRMFKCRAARVSEGDLCALDSTTRTGYGSSLADVRYGRNKEHLPLPVSVEVVVYDLNTHMPIYYRTFPGNIPDSRSVGTVLDDIKDAGFPDITLITDRGYESIRNLERYILDGQRLIAWVKVNQKMVTDRIKEFGTFSHSPQGMEIDEEALIYYKQYDLDYEVDVRAGCTKKSDRLKLNLYFDPVRRSAELMDLDVEIKKQRLALEAIKAEGSPMDDDATVKRNYSFFNVEINEGNRKLKSFTLNQKKVDSKKLVSGFFANVTHAIDLTAMQASESYALRDEQEKCFEQEKTPMGTDRQRCWSEDGKNGRLFINFVAMIMGSYIKHVWKTTILKKEFCSFTEILDEMRPIRCVEHKGHTRHITPFVGRQVDIFKTFGFEIPKECDVKYTSKKSREKKRGRPRKSEVVTEPKE